MLGAVVCGCVLVCSGVHLCTLVCTGVYGCGWIYAGVLGRASGWVCWFVQVCIGVCVG